MNRLSGIDTAALLLETDACPLQMMAVLLLDTSAVPGGYSYEGLRNFLERRIHVVPPLLRQLANVPGAVHRPVWIDAETIDWDYHLPRTVVTEPLDLARLGLIAGELAGQLLDRARPLWQLRVVEDATGDRVALVARVHHALMDGLGGMEFMAALFDIEAQQPEPLETVVVHGEPPPSRLTLLGRAVADLPALPVNAAKLAASGTRAALQQLRQPPDGDTRSPLPFSSPRTILNGRLTSRRSVALRRVSFDTVRNVARATESTVNDVVLAVVSGALRRYLLEHDACPLRRLVAGVPAATDAPDAGFGNAFTFLFVHLATDVDDPVERLRIIRYESALAKRRGQNIGMNTLTSALDMFTPVPIAAALTLYRNTLVDLLPPLWNVLVSNVPGPPVPLYVAGARLVGLFPLGPVYEGLGLNITVLSREGDLDVGIVASADRMPDVERLADLLADGLEELVRALELDQLVR